jgi:hypothetical protein
MSNNYLSQVEPGDARHPVSEATNQSTGTDINGYSLWLLSTMESYTASVFSHITADCVQISETRMSGCTQSLRRRSRASASGGISPALENLDGFQLISCFHERIPKKIDSSIFPNISKSRKKSQRCSRASKRIAWFFFFGCSGQSFNCSCFASIVLERLNAQRPKPNRKGRLPASFVNAERSTLLQGS